MHIRTRRRQEDGPTLTVSIYYDDVLERDDGRSGNCDTGHAHVHECVRAAAEFTGSHREQKAVCEDYDYSVQTAVCDASDKHGTDVKAGHRHSGVREGVNDYDDDANVPKTMTTGTTTSPTCATTMTTTCTTTSSTRATTMTTCTTTSPTCATTMTPTCRRRRRRVQRRRRRVRQR